MPTSHKAAQQQREVLSRYEVTPKYCNTPGAARVMGTSCATVMRLVMVDSTFPRPIYISERKRLFRIADLEGWMEAQRGKAEQPPSIREQIDGKSKTSQRAKRS